MKLISVAVATLVVLSGNVAMAQTQTPSGTATRTYTQHRQGNGVTANGRCGGISYGTGARSCGTATGGPAGGNSSRN